VTDLHDVDGADSAESGIWASDALIDALSAGASFDDDRASALLSALVSDVSAEPLPGLPVLAPPRRTRRLAPRTGIAAGAVIAVLSTGGVAAASVSAGPTSALFPLHRVLTGQSQLDGSQRQALEVKDKLASAAKALAAGKYARAQKDVQSAADRLPKVAVTDGHRDLAAQWTALNRQVKAKVTTTPATSSPSKTTSSPTSPRTSAPARSTSPAPSQAPTVPAGGTTTPVTTSPSASQVAGGAPGTGLTSPVPVTPTPVPSQTPTVSPSPSDPAGTSSPTPTPSSTSSGKHHRPGGGNGGNVGSGGSVAPGSPPAASLAPPSTAPVTVPPAQSAAASSAPVTVPPAPSVTPSPSAS
jgi:hypothetical protein